MQQEILQGSREWLELRKTKVTASETPIIMGVSPYKTPYRLWLEKTDRVPPPPPSSSMLYGTQKEASIRQEYTRMTGLIAEPTLSFSPEHEWLMASLDGLSEDGKVIFEAKTCNFELYEHSLSDPNYVPSHYWWQLQTQLACTPSAERVDYVLYNKGRELLIRHIVRDEKFLDGIEKCYEFWQMVMENNKDRHPGIQMDDHVFVEENPDFEQAAKEWASAKASLKECVEREALAREKLLAQGDGGSMMGYGVKIDRIIKEGNVQYDKIPLLDGIDLKKYRKAPSVYFKITGVDLE